MAVVPSDESWRTTQELSGVSQGTMSRWRTGESVPDRAAVVAKFAVAYGHNPLEAFVAAGMLSEDEAGRGLSRSDRAFLAALIDSNVTNIRNPVVSKDGELDTEFKRAKKSARLRRNSPSSD